MVEHILARKAIVERQSLFCVQRDSHSLWRLGRLVSGYIEFAEEIVKISSVEDIERVLERIKATDKA